MQTPISATSEEKKCPMCKSSFSGTMVVCDKDGTLLMAVKRQLQHNFASSNYEILSQIARGSTSEVFSARRRDAQELVAIKILSCDPRHPQFDRKKERFLRQVDAHRKLQHHNIVQLIAHAETDKGVPFLVFELVENGCSLADFRSRMRLLPANYFKRIFIDVCDALSYAHEQGVVHHNLTPDDILISGDANDETHVRVTDFAKGGALIHGANQRQQATEKGDLFGNPVFMSPETSMGQLTTPLSNIYSLGCIMYTVLSKKELFEGAHWVATMMQKHFQKVDPLELEFEREWSDGIESIIATCMEPDPGARFQSMTELGKRLRALPAEKISYTVFSSVAKARPDQI